MAHVWSIWIVLFILISTITIQKQWTYQYSRLRVVIVIINITLSVTGLDKASNFAIQGGVTRSICSKHEQVGCIRPPTNLVLMKRETDEWIVELVCEWIDSTSLISIFCGGHRSSTFLQVPLLFQPVSSLVDIFVCCREWELWLVAELKCTFKIFNIINKDNDTMWC